VQTVTQDLVWNVTGQVLRFPAPEGRPSSVTSLEVFPWDAGDDSTAETAFGTPAVETDPNTTLDANAAAPSTGARTLALTATTGIEIGRRYLLTGPNSETEWPEVVAIESGVGVTVRHLLQHQYNSGNAFVSTLIEATVVTAWIQDDANISDAGGQGTGGGWRARWTYVVGGNTYVHDSYFDVVRYAFDLRVKPVDIDRAAPGWVHRLPVDYRDGAGQAQLITRAANRVRMDLTSTGIADQLWRDEEVMEHLVILRTILESERTRMLNGGDNAETFAMSKEDYDNEFMQHVKAHTSGHIARTSSGAGEVTRPRSLFTR